MYLCSRLQHLKQTRRKVFNDDYDHVNEVERCVLPIFT